MWRSLDTARLGKEPIVRHTSCSQPRVALTRARARLVALTRLWGRCRYENDGIFDKFRCSWSPDSRYFVTGSYSNLYGFHPCERCVAEGECTACRLPIRFVRMIGARTHPARMPIH